MTQQEILQKIQAKLVRTKELFPTKSEQRRGRNVVTEGVYVTDTAAFMQYLEDHYTITPKDNAFID